MVYFINLSYKDNAKTMELRKKGYACINDTSVAVDKPLHKVMWRTFFTNAQLTDLIICYTRWNNHIRDYSIYATTHGIRVGIIDLTLNITLKFKPTLNLPRNLFASSATLDAAYENVWVEGRDLKNKHRKQPKSAYLLKNLKADNMKYFSDIEERRRANEELLQFARLGDDLNVQAIEQVLPTFALGYELDERLRQYAERNKNYMRLYNRLPKFKDSYDYAIRLLSSKNRKIQEMANKIYASLQDVHPLDSRDALIDFGQTWAARYELSYPTTPEEAIQTGVIILYYIQNNIEPCRDIRTEDLISYEQSAYLFESTDDDEVAADNL